MKAKYITTYILFPLLLIGCNHLDFDETSGLNTKEDIYKYFGTTENLLTHIYSFVPQGYPFQSSNNVNPDDLALLDAASDDAEFGAVSASIQNLNNGNWSALKPYNSAWGLYRGVRAANSFLQEIQNVDYSRYQYDGRYENWMKKLQYFPFEARVLRAYYFFELAKRYGDIAMPLTVLDHNQANSIAKTSFSQVIDFIVQECTESASNLPESYDNEPDKQIGRITKGVALAIKSKALLYAASKLHNPNMDVEPWKKSAQAALDIIELNVYSLTKGNTANNPLAKEVVFVRMNNESSNYELYNFPVSYTAGRSVGAIAYRNFPSQNLVDAFETINGYKVTLENTGWVSQDPSFNPQDPYKNRDPRFYRTILANGMTFKETTIEAFHGGKDYASAQQGGSPTGYFLRKYIQETTNFTPSSEVTNKHHWTIYRYSETLLSYAESMINSFGDPNYTDANFKYSALWAINQVRANADMPAINTSDKNTFIEILYNEWRVEFAFEDHRFWDVRRWKIADVSQRELYGVKIEKTSSNNLQFYKVLHEIRNWSDRMYLFPIPQDELYKNTNLAPQNSGW